MKPSGRTAFIFLSFFLPVFSFSQTVKWERVYGASEYEYGRSVQQTADGGYIVAGTSSSYSAATDMYLLKLRPDGTFRWHKVYGGGNDEWAYSVRQTPSDGGYIVCGFSNSMGSGGYDVYLVKTDSLGNQLWARTYGGSDWDFGYSVDLTSDGGYVIAGSTFSYGAGGEDAFLVKTDANGTMQWFNVYGGIADDNATQVKQTADGGYILSARTKSFSIGNYDMWAIKTTLTGDTAWTRRFGSTAEDAFNSVTRTADGGYAFAGYTYGNNPTADNYIVKLDANGTVQGIQNDIVPAGDSRLQSITQNTDGTYFTVGYFNYGGGGGMDFVFFKWDQFLNYMPCCASSRGGPEDEFAYSGQQTSDKGFIIAGNTASWGNGKTDIFIVKLDSNFSYTNTPLVGIASEPEHGSPGLKIFPVPASEKIYFDVQENLLQGEVSISITDLLGREVLKYSNAVSFPVHGQREFSVPVSFLTDGVYLLKAGSASAVLCGRFMVKH